MTGHRPAALPSSAPMTAAGSEVSLLRRRLVQASLFMALTFVVGVLGYKALAPDATWATAIYMTANVVSTTGFREAISTENNPAREIFTIFLLIFGAGTVVYFTSVMTAFVVEGDLTQGFRRRRMARAIDEMTDHYVICGSGNAGRAVIAELVATRRPVIAIEPNADHARRAEQDFPGVPVIVGDATSDEVLLQAGVTRARGVVVCIDDDRDSLVATVTARQLNPRARIIARATDERGCARIRAAGADAVVAPSSIGGMRMASEMLRPSVVGFLDTMLRDRQQNLRIEEVEVPMDSTYVGRKVGDLDLRAEGNLLLLAIHEPSGRAYVYNPAPDHQIASGSQLIVMGDPAGVERMRKKAATGAS